jgi:hypothetical protein
LTRQDLEDVRQAALGYAQALMRAFGIEPADLREGGRVDVSAAAETVPPAEPDEPPAGSSPLDFAPGPGATVLGALVGYAARGEPMSRRRP